MTKLEAIYFIIKIAVSIISLWFSGRKLYRWYRMRNKRKSHR